VTPQLAQRYGHTTAIHSLTADRASAEWGACLASIQDSAAAVAEDPADDRQSEKELTLAIEQSSDPRDLPLVRSACQLTGKGVRRTRAGDGNGARNALRQSSALVRRARAERETPAVRLADCYLQAAMAYYEARAKRWDQARQRLIFVFDEERLVLQTLPLSSIWQHRLQQVNNWASLHVMAGEKDEARGLTANFINYLLRGGGQERLPSDGWPDDPSQCLSAAERDALIAEAAAALPSLYTPGEMQAVASQLLSICTAPSAMATPSAGYVAAWLALTEATSNAGLAAHIARFVALDLPQRQLRSLWIDAVATALAVSQDLLSEALAQRRASAIEAVRAVPALRHMLTRHSPSLNV